MKYNIFSLVLIGLLFGLSSCDDDSVDLTFTVDSPQSLIAPADGASLVFTEMIEQDSVEFAWTAAQFTPEDVQNPNYRLQMDFAGNDFKAPMAIASTTELSYKTTVASFNNNLSNWVVLEGMDTTLDLELRVIGNFDGIPVDTFFSNVNSLTATLYNTNIVVEASPIYLLGSATSAGWDNQAALEMTPLPDGQFRIFAPLLSGQEIKFISQLGSWQPQWGTDGTGTWEAGPLMYEAVDPDPDPMGIPSPDVDGQYKIIADTANLTYEVSAADEIYLLGSGTMAAWDNAVAIPFTVVDEGVHTIVAELLGGNEWKIIDDLGAWAPQWGTDGTGDWMSGTLAYRPDEMTPDPAAIPTPEADGTYRIDINLNDLTYTVTPE